MPRNYTPKPLDQGGMTPERVNARKQAQFARVLLENGGFVERAIRECHTSRRWLNDQLANDEEFAALFQAIKDQNNEKIEEEIYRRAVIGNDKPLAYKGELTGAVVREYSDNLLMFLAKANMPTKYRDLPQKGSELSEEELNERISAWMKKRGESQPLTTDTVM